LVPPLVVAAFQVVGEWRRNPYWGIVKICLVMTAIGVVALGVVVLALAWVVAEVTQQWSARADLRAILGGLLGAGCGALTLLSANSQESREQCQANGAATVGDPDKSSETVDPTSDSVSGNS
jgi:hypothetical protein